MHGVNQLVNAVFSGLSPLVIEDAANPGAGANPGRAGRLSGLRDRDGAGRPTCPTRTPSPAGWTKDRDAVNAALSCPHHNGGSADLALRHHRIRDRAKSLTPLLGSGVGCEEKECAQQDEVDESLESGGSAGDGGQCGDDDSDRE